MGNLKVVAVFLFTVFLGLFLFQNIKKGDKATRDIAQESTVKESAEKPQAQVKTAKNEKPNKMREFKGQELLLAAGMKYENVPKLEVKKDAQGPYGSFPTYKGKLLAEFYDGNLHPPENKAQKLLFSPDPEHPELDAKVAKKFKGYGYDQDKKMEVKRGQQFYIVIQGEAVAVQEYHISYNWKGEREKDRYLIRSSNGRIYRKIKSPPIVKN